MRRILFIVNGTGLGNATRCAAVMDEIRGLDPNCQMAVIAGGRAYDFFQHKLVDRLDRLEVTSYADPQEGRSPVHGLPRIALKFFVNGAQNALRIYQMIREFRPHQAILDSNYNLIPVLFPGLKCIHLNSSGMVFREFLLIARSHPKEMRGLCLQFFFVELPDYLYHKIFARNWIAPWFESRPPFVFGPISRTSKSVEALQNKIVFMLSSYRDQHFWDRVVAVFGSENCVKALGSYSAYEDLHSARFAVVNGGYSSIAECLAARVPILVIPIPGHAEQYFNARWIEERGLGLCAKRENFDETLKAFIQAESRIRSALAAFHVESHAAEQVSRQILQELI